ncbi:nuclease [Apophysomyces sp. BC1034]|nr:nuclease [Apophysomyces sp. BC1021]KAG0172672.1 nuclease [Apophysomyces sp. BC1015]KAG0192247.1 nuclease [Apophysomyces sp. BC1034]
MANPSQFLWLSVGFFLGLLCMFGVGPREAVQQCQQLHRHVARDVDEGILQFGNPGPISDLLKRDEYVTAFNRRDRVPNWVGEHLTKESLTPGPNVSRKHSKFTEDTSVPALFRALLSDYRGSGFDRGHMAPAGDAVATQEAMDQTFLLTNMSPQVGVGFNRNYWAYLEAFVRDLTGNFTDVYVYTGPLFLPKKQAGQFSKRGAPEYTMTYSLLGDANVAVPTHFYKVILIPQGNGFASAAFVLPNEAIDSETPLMEFKSDLVAIEKASGLVYFDKLDRSQFTDLCDITNCDVKRFK